MNTNTVLAMLAANASARDGDKQQGIYTRCGKYKWQRKHSRPTGEFKEKQDKQVTAMSLESSRRNRISKSQRCHWRVQGHSALASQRCQWRVQGHSALASQRCQWRVQRQVDTAISLESSKTRKSPRCHIRICLGTNHHQILVQILFKTKKKIPRLDVFRYDWQNVDVFW